MSPSRSDVNKGRLSCRFVVQQIDFCKMEQVSLARHRIQQIVQQIEIMAFGLKSLTQLKYNWSIGL